MKQLADNFAFKTWSLDEWNIRLVSGILRQVGASGVYEPLIRLTVTPDTLTAVVSPGSAPGTLFRSFQSCITSHVLGTGHAFDTAAEHLQDRNGWTPSSDSDPPFWAHLVFTCYVAGTPEISARNYRERLCSTLPGTGHQSLTRLPQLWKNVSAWTRNQSRRFGNCRILVLPDPRSRTIIGYSYFLAFPSRRDNEILVKALKAADLLGAEPPVTSAMAAIENELRRFSDAFRGAYERFRRQWYAHRANDGRDRFWAAVREAAMHGRGGDLGDVQWSIMLGEELDGDPYLWVVAADPYKSRQWMTITTDISGEDVNLVCWESAGLDQAQEAVEQVLSGHTIPGGHSALSQAIAEGVLLFECSGPGIYRFSPRLTDSRNFYLLVKEMLEEKIRRALGTDGPLGRYRGWRMLGPLSCERLETAVSRNKLLAGTRALQATAPPPRIYVSGGFYADSGTSTYIGFSTLLPHLKIDGADDLRVESDTGATIRLQRRNAEKGEWSFPQGADVEGGWIAIALCSGEELATLRLRFSLEYHGHDYRQMSDRSAWLTEAPSGQLLGYNQISDEEVTSESDLFDADKWNVQYRTFAQSERSEDDTNKVDQLSVALASMFSHRRALPESELLTLFRRILDIKDYEFWHVYRSWQEAGRLRRLYARRWRSFVSVPVRPHLIAHRGSGHIQATTSGLWYPELTNKLHNICDQERIPISGLYPGSLWSPVSYRIAAQDLATIRHVAQQCTIADVQPLFPIETIQGANVLYAAERLEAPAARNPEIRHWNFAREIGSNSPGEVDIEQAIVSNQPDVYRVCKSGQIVYWTRSRTEAWLVASWVAGNSSFRNEGTRGIAMLARQSYLPLVVGQYASVFDIASPSIPVGVSSHYRYDLGSGRLRDLISSTLLPLPKATSRRCMELARLVIGLVSRPGSSSMIPVSAVPGWRRFVSLADARQLASRTHVPADVIPFVAAAIRQP